MHLGRVLDDEGGKFTSLRGAIAGKSDRRPLAL